MRFIYTKAFVFFTACLAIIAGGLFLQVNGYLAPVQDTLLNAPQPAIRLVQNITLPVRNFVSNLLTVRKVISENDLLIAKVNELQTKLVELDKLRTENDSFKKDLQFVQANPAGLQPCTVLSRDPQNLTDTLVLNCGKNQGLEEGQAVISEGYLVGKIIFAGQSTSTALLITNSQSIVDARVSNNSSEGIVKGSYGSGILLDLVSQNAQLTKGDIVVTAGINSHLAPNIPIGEVGDVISNPNELFKRTSLSTPIKFHNITYVFIAKR